MPGWLVVESRAVKHSELGGLAVGVEKLRDRFDTDEELLSNGSFPMSVVEHPLHQNSPL